MSIDYEKITTNQFEEIMNQLKGKSIWLKIQTETVVYDILYENFEFLSFVNGNYQFGFDEYDEENIHRSIMIEKDHISYINRDAFAPSMGAEQIILELVCGEKLFVEYGY